MSEQREIPLSAKREILKMHVATHEVKRSIDEASDKLILYLYAKHRKAGSF